MFLEERFGLIQGFGARASDYYAADVQVTKSGLDYTRLIHPYPILRAELPINNRTESAVVSALIDLFHRSGGPAGGFRFKNDLDYSTNNYKNAPTATDQQCIFVSGIIWQLVRWYGTQGDLTQTRRIIYKPIIGGTVLAAIAGFPTTRFSADTTNGQITFVNNSKNINGITLGTTTQIDFTASHSLVAGESVLLSSIGGTTELNGNRYEILSIVDADSIEIDVDSSAFTAYTSGGQADTDPTSSEIVTAGCYYDIPVRFESNLNEVLLSSRSNSELILNSQVSLIEKLNP